MLKQLILIMTSIISAKTGVMMSPCENAANFQCEFPNDCKLGDNIMAVCKNVQPECQPDVEFKKEAQCRFCYQTEPEHHRCQTVTNCSTSSHKLVRTVCTVKEDIVCIGRRTFLKNVHCNWTSGTSWSKTMMYSVILGGFGADRFYLGLWKSAIGKLFSFGGLGIWTIVDVVLIAIGYIKPGDGSNYN